MFRDRKDAGEQLARALTHYKDKGVLVLAIPRGGVEVGYQVAVFLNADFNIIVTRKLPFPDNPEAGFGALAEDGSTFLFQDAAAWLAEERVSQIIAEQQEEITRRIDALRKGEPLPGLQNRTVILIDDGIAMGSTMRASILLCKKRAAGKIVVATPVTGEDTAAQISELVDEMVVLETPPWFRAVAQVYEHWYDVPDSEVIEIMNRWRHFREEGAE